MTLHCFPNDVNLLLENFIWNPAQWTEYRLRASSEGLQVSGSPYGLYKMRVLWAVLWDMHYVIIAVVSCGEYYPNFPQEASHGHGVECLVWVCLEVAPGTPPHNHTSAIFDKLGQPFLILHTDPCAGLPDKYGFFTWTCLFVFLHRQYLCIFGICALCQPVQDVMI